MKTLNLAMAKAIMAFTVMMVLFTVPATADVKDQMVERRAIEAAVWGMPIVNFQAMRDALKNDAGVGFNDVAYNSKVQTWRLRMTTNNNTTPYIFIFWNVKDVPVEHFWSVIAYNSEDGAWYKNQPKAGIASSDKGVKVNDDGSIDIFFGPKAPAGQQANSVPTTPNTHYWLFFRFYGPEPAVFTKSWQLPDLEEVN